MSAERVCLTPGCGRAIRARGLCQNCYGAARLRVNSVPGITWEALEAAGLVLPSKKAKSANTEEESVTFAAAFDAAMVKQDDAARKDKEAHDQRIAEVAIPPERVVDTRSTVAGIRRAAEAVAANPSAENLACLANVQFSCRQPAPISAMLPKLESQPKPENVPTPVYVDQRNDPNQLPPLAPGMVWENGPAGPQARAMTQEELIIAERKKAIANNRELRERSLLAARGESAGESDGIDQGDPQETGMSDAEFERIKNAYLIRTGKMPKPPPRPVVVPLIPRPVPTFPEPELPTDVPYTPSLDGGGGAAPDAAAGVLEASELDPDVFTPADPIMSLGGDDN